MNMKQEMNSFSIVHFIILASILEPIPEKVGCTTRYKDWQEKSKLEYFLIAGVNIGNTFYELMERIKENNYEQPHVIYDLAYKAQKESLKNRKGGKINFGIIELFIPIITAQLVFGKMDITVLDYVEQILKNTSKEDVQHHLAFRKIGRIVSKQFPSTLSYDVDNLYDYYALAKNDIENNVHKEYITKFPRVKKVYSILENNFKEGNLLATTVLAYDYILKECNDYYGLAADYICIALYFYLINHPNVVIV